MPLRFFDPWNNRGKIFLRVAKESGIFYYTVKLKGGYLSVVNMKAYAATLKDHRYTSTTKLNIPLGYRPVNKMANQAIMVITQTAIWRKHRTI